MTNKLILLIAVLTCACPLLAQSSGQYVGATRCTPCHNDIVKGWETTAHAQAFASLKKSSQENLPGCVKCHVTGYEQEAGFVDHDLTPNLEGVQCEECHGPGRRHIDSGGDKQNIVRSSGPSLCVKCHTPGQDKNFNYANKVKFVHGGDTEAKPPAIVATGKLSITPTNKNFGVIDEGVPAQLVATLTNTGTTDITITNVRTN